MREHTNEQFRLVVVECQEPNSQTLVKHKQEGNVHQHTASKLCPSTSTESLHTTVWKCSAVINH